METIPHAYEVTLKFVDDLDKSTNKQNKVLRLKENRYAWYAEWDDSYMTSLLNSKIAKTAFKRIADSFYGGQLEDILKDATELTDGSYPNLYGVYSDCCNVLGMYNTPKAYVSWKIRGINALSMEVLDKQLILISPQVATSLSVKEQSFLLGHEISHHQQGNLVCHTVSGLTERLNNKTELLGSLINEALDLSLKRWSRCSEFNADRGGYLCCKDIESIKALFDRIEDGMNLSDYKSVVELSNAHPTIESRLQQLFKYSRSA